nr:DUF1642 domain-containing protein [Streptococcus lutetiensis]
MNKQEYQQKIKNMKRPKFFNAITLDEAYEAGFEEAKNNALFESCFLDEPEKPVVPQYVADFYESIKDGFENKVYDLCVQFNFDKSELNDDVAEWFDHQKNKPIETLVMMHKFGYEIEKEKLYTVEIPNGFIRLVLCKDCDGKLFVATFSGGDCWETFGKCKLTEAEIKEDFEWAWQFAEEVEND